MTLSPQSLHLLDTVISRNDDELTLVDLIALSALEVAADANKPLLETINAGLDRVESAVFNSLSWLSAGFAIPTEFATYLAMACARISRMVGQSPVVISRVVAGQLEEVARFGDTLTYPSALEPWTPEAVSIAENRPVSTFDVPVGHASALESPYLVVPILDDNGVLALLHCRVTSDLLRPATAYLRMAAEIIATVWECVALENQLGEHISDIRFELESAAADAVAAPIPNQASHASLTAREIDVLRLIRNGATNATIATALFISVETVKSHVKNLLRKTSAANRAELIGRNLSAHFASKQ